MTGRCEWVGPALVMFDEDHVLEDERIRDLVAKLSDGSIQIANADTTLTPSKEILMSRPKTSSIDSSGLDHITADLSINVYTDGRRTEVLISDPDFDDGKYIAAGVAMRRKGEKPKPDAGIALAMGRALRELSERYFKIARISGLPEAKR
jgi:hypothetical protein